MTLSTHVLDVAAGAPAAGIAVELLQRTSDGWLPLSRHTTDADGRVHTLLPQNDSAMRGSEFRLVFDAGAYFARRTVETFYRHVPIDFVVNDAASHYHVPLLLSPFGYSTYRGS
jgi:5-hydroxyisourate hydrolase